jgi:hypothetical protein
MLWSCRLRPQTDVGGGALGAAEKMTGKIMGDPGKQARSREREVRSPSIE